MSKPIRLRVQSSKGQSTVTIDPSSSLADLLCIPEIGYDSFNSKNSIKIKTGFPPKNVDVSDLTKSLVDCEVQNGDRLIIDFQEEISSKRQIETDSSSDQRPHKKSPTPLRYEESNKSVSSYCLPNGTFLVQRKMPADNSCFFRAVAQAYYNDSSLALMLRQNVANYIKENQNDYSEVVLGRPVLEYCDWILWETSWGGGIEAAILSKFLGVRIITIEVENGTKIDISDQNLNNFLLLLYDGSHYDLIAQTSSADLSSTKDDTSIFKPFDANIHFLSTYIEPEQIIKHSQEFAKTLRKTTPLMNLENNDVLFLCKDCNTQFKGLQAVNEHAEVSNHVNFTEAKKMI